MDVWGQPQGRRMESLCPEPDYRWIQLDNLQFFFLLLFLNYSTGSREWNANLYWRMVNEIKIVSTSSPTSFAFILVFRVYESHFGSTFCHFIASTTETGKYNRNMSSEAVFFYSLSTRIKSIEIVPVKRKCVIIIWWVGAHPAMLRVNS